jgi:hypothetical protein
MPAVVQNILAFVLGIVLGSVVNMALITVSPLVVPPPAGVDTSDPESLAANIDRFEPKHFVFPLAAHALGTFAGALVAFVTAKSYRRVLAYAVSLLSLAGGIAMAAMLPAPLWFEALDLVVAYIPMAWLATLVGQRMVGAYPASNLASGSDH